MIRISSLLLFILLGLLIIIGGYLLYQAKFNVPYKQNVQLQSTPSSSQSTPTVTVSNERIISLGEEFTLKKEAIARIKDQKVLLRIISFTNSPCPKGAACLWSGVEVVYELTIDGKPYQYSSSRGANPYDVSYEAPYDVFVKGSDYETYAKFVIDTPEAKCLRLNQDSNSLCWTGLAKRFKNPSYCQKINRVDDRERCLDNLR